MLHAMSWECKKFNSPCELAACSENTDHIMGVFGVVTVS